MYQIKRLVTGVWAPRIGSQNVDITTLNDLPEEILATILEGTPENEIRNFRIISRNFNSSIKARFGTTLTINASRQDFPESIREGHVTILKLKDFDSLNPQDLPPLSRLRKLEIGGKMRLQTLVRIMGETPNLRKVSIKFPKILELDFDGTMVLNGLPARIEAIKIEFEKNEREIKVESSLLQILSQLPLTSLKKFNCTYVNTEKRLIAGPMASQDDLSYLIKTILTKSGGTLRDLELSRPYDWPEKPESIQIEKEFKLGKLGLFWVGESRWLRSLIDAQKTRGGLESLIISCYEDLWVEGVVQEVALGSSATLKRLTVNLHLKNDQIIRDELSLGFLDQLLKLELFDIKSRRGFEKMDGRRNLDEFLAPLILPKTLKKAILRAPITFQTLQSFCALPTLEELTLEGFKWVDWSALIIIWDYMEEITNGMPVNVRPSILLDWNWLMNLLKNCPSLKSIHFSNCVLDFEGIFYHLLHLAKSGALVDFEDLRKFSYYSLDLETPDVDKQTLFAYTFSINIEPNRPATFIDVCKSIINQVGHVMGPSSRLAIGLNY